MRIGLAALVMTVLLGACGAGVPAARGRVPKPTAVPVVTTSSTAPTTTTTSAPEQTLAGHSDASVAAVEAYWAAAFPEAYGPAWQAVASVSAYDVDRDGPPSCGGEVLDASLARGNAFYCPADDAVAWDEDGLLRPLFEKYGPFAVSLVIAHEWGHAVQNRAGVSEVLPTIIREVQADCLAGSWAGWAMETGVLAIGEGDLDVALAGFLLFRDPVGTSAGQAGAHGSGFDRVGAFLDGFRGGASVCVPYAEEATFPPITQIPFFSAEEAATGGNLPADQVFPTLTATLETYWADTASGLGITWDPVDAFGALDDAADCPGGVVDPDGVGVAYCRSTDTLLFDDVGVLGPLYRNFGDFGPAFVLGLGWAQKAILLGGDDPTDPDAELRADCLVGNWAAAGAVGIPTGATRADGQPEVIRLSSGDLDEAIQAILFLGESGAGSADAFERFEAFRRGFLGAAVDC